MMDLRAMFDYVSAICLSEHHDLCRRVGDLVVGMSWRTMAQATHMLLVIGFITTAAERSVAVQIESRVRGLLALVKILSKAESINKASNRPVNQGLAAAKGRPPRSLWTDCCNMLYDVSAPRTSAMARCIVAAPYS